VLANWKISCIGNIKCEALNVKNIRQLCKKIILSMNIVTSVFDIFIVSPAYHYINAKRQSISDVNLPLLISAKI
jgi:hypothetical protein